MKKPRREVIADIDACYDPRTHTPGATARLYDVGFIGGAGPARERLLSALADRGLLSDVFGVSIVTTVYDRVECGHLPRRSRKGSNIVLDRRHSWQLDAVSRVSFVSGRVFLRGITIDSAFTRPNSLN